MADELIKNPTWRAPIKSFFNDIDVSHMLSVSEEMGIDPPIDLSDYNSVVQNKDDILAVVTSGSMPRPPSSKWHSDLVAIFKTWVDNDCPET
jgi:hypothetical protein